MNLIMFVMIGVIIHAPWWYWVTLFTPIALVILANVFID